MSSPYHNQRQLANRRRRPSYLPSFSTIVTTAALTVGTYHLAKWAWENYGKQQQEQPHEQQAAAAVRAATTEVQEEETIFEEHTVIEEEVVVEEEEEVVEDEEAIDEETNDDVVASQSVRFLLPGRSTETPARRDHHEHQDSLTNKASSMSSSMKQNHHTATTAPTTPTTGPTMLASVQMHIRKQRMSRCRDETSMALIGFLSTVRKIVERRTDTIPETKALKQLRAQYQQQQQLPPPQPERHNHRSNGSYRGGNDSLTTSFVSDDDDDDDAFTYRREREYELWEQIKIKSITRLLATAYAHTILFLVLTVQVNLLGGRLFEEQVSGTNVHHRTNHHDDSDAEAAAAAAAQQRLTAYQSSHRLVLTHTYQYWFEHGLQSLLDTIEQAASRVLSTWNVLDPTYLHMTRDEFEHGLQHVRMAIKENSGSSALPPGHCRSLLRFLLPPSSTMTLSSPHTNGEHASTGASSPPSPPVDLPDDLARSILDETWDLLESPVLEDALTDCLKVTFDTIRDQHWGTVFESDDAIITPNHEISSSSPPPPADKKYITRPLATVLTKLKKAANSLYEGQQQQDGHAPTTSHTTYCDTLQQLPSVLELADVSFS